MQKKLIPSSVALGLAVKRYSENWITKSQVSWKAMIKAALDNLFQGIRVLQSRDRFLSK